MKTLFQLAFLKIVLAFFLLGFVATVRVSAQSPLSIASGATYTINSGIAASSSNFVSFTTAIAALNNTGNGVITSPVTFNVAAGYSASEAPLTINKPLVNETGINAGEVSITFQKDPSTTGANPIVNSSGGANTAALMITSGDDYTISGINFTTTAGTGCSWGIVLLGATNDGCQNNTIKNCTINNFTNVTVPTLTPLNSTGNAGIGIYAYGQAASVAGQNNSNIYSNNTIKNVIDGFDLTTVTATSNFDLGNQISNNSITNFGFTSSIVPTTNVSCFAIVCQSQPGVLVFGNFIDNTSYPTAEIASTNVLYGIQCLQAGAGAAVMSVYNNFIQNISSNGLVNCIALTLGSSTIVVYNNVINGISSSANTVNGVLLQAIGTAYIYKNTIHNLSYTGTLTTAFAYGIDAAALITQIQTGYIYDNMIYDIRADAGTAAFSTSANGNVVGIFLGSGSASCRFYLYYNTVYLSNTSSTQTQSAAVCQSTGNTMEMRNNVLVNNYTFSGAGKAIAFARRSSSYTTLSSNSNNNLVYAGTPGSTRLLLYDGTNSCQLLNSSYGGTTPYYQSTSTSETGTVTGAPGFINASSPYDVHINPCAGTSPALYRAVPIVSGTLSAPISVPNDFDGNTRGNGATLGSSPAPTIGADEVVAPSVTSNTSTNPTACGTASGNIKLKGTLAAYSIYAVTYNKNGSPVGSANYTSDSSGALIIPLGAGTYSNFVLTIGGSCTTTAYPASSGTIVLTDPSGSVSISVTETSGGTNNDGIICNGDPVTLTASASSSYSWNATSGTTGQLTNAITLNPTLTTTYTVSVIDGGGCAATATQVITVNSCGFNITASAGANGSISPSGTVSVSTGANQTFNFTPNTCYVVTGITVDGSTVAPASSYTFTNVTSAHSISVTFGYSPISISVSPNPATICSGGATLTAAGASTYSWSPSSGLGATTGANVLATSGSAATYTVTGTSLAGCTGTSTVSTIPATPLAGGTYTIGVDFPTVAAAIAKLNCDGISGAVTFNVPSTWTETFTSPTAGLINIPANLPTPTNTIVFQKSGGGSSFPLITAGTGTGQLDGIIVLQGMSNITFDGIDVQDNAANTTLTTRMEFGYALLKNNPSTPVGCQNIVIKNCHVTLNNTFLSVYYTTYNTYPTTFASFPVGIYCNNHTPTDPTDLTVASLGGANSNNQFYSNTISNVFSGIVMWGANNSSFYDLNNQIGVSGANTISYKGTSSTVVIMEESWGVYEDNQKGLQVSNNTFNMAADNTNASGGPTSGVQLYGVYNDNGGTDLTVNNNLFTLSYTGGSASYTVSPISNTTTSGNINIYSNTITTSSWTTTGNGQKYFAIQNTVACTNLNIYNNLITNNNPPAGTNTGEAIYNTGNVTGTLNIYGNTISGNSFRPFLITVGQFIYSTCTPLTTYQIYGNIIFNNTSAGASSGIYVKGTASPLIYNNLIYGNSSLAATTTNGITNASTGGTQSVYGNTIYNLSSAGSVNGINNTGSSAASIYDNYVYHLNNSGSSGTVNGIANSAGTTTAVYNNMIYDLTAGASTTLPAVAGISITGGTTQNVYYNTVYLNGSSSTAGHKTGALYITGGAVDLRNNILDNSSSESGSGSMAIALYKSAFSNANLASTSNNNLVYAGTPGSANLLVSEGTTTTASTLNAYKSTLSPYDNNAVTGDPLFANTSAYPNEDVHLQNIGLLSPAINSGVNITTPIIVSDDIDGPGRPLGVAGKYDIGADEINELQPTAPTLIAGANPQCTNSSLTFSMPAISNATSYKWTLPGTLGTDYTISGSSTSNTITVTYANTVSGNVTSNGVLVPAGSGYTYTGPASSGLSFSTISQPTVTATNTPSVNSICLGDVLGLAASGSGSSTYSWLPATGLDSNTGASVNANPTSSITYTVTATASNGCTNNTTDVVTVKPLPPLVVTPNNAVCTGGTSAVLTASGASTYTWSPTSNLTPGAGTSAIETAQISALTIYTVTGTNTTTGCTANAVVPVATVAVGGTIAPAFSIICNGGTKALTVTGAAGNDYQWQISSNNITWTNISGATATTYTTTSGDGATNKFYRLLANSNACWNVASTTAEVDVSQPTIAVSVTNITDNSLTLNWTPTGTGNYTISYSGTSSATQTSVTPAKTITGLSSSGNYTIVVTQTGVTGCSASGTTSANTLCAMPTGVTLSSPANAQILVNWTGVGGANYRVYYRPLFAFGYFFTKDVSGVSSALITKQGANNLYGSTTYEVYVSRLDCPTTGLVGQGTNPTNVTTLPAVSCGTPVIDSVRSLCPVQIEVFMHPGSSPSGSYNIYLQRITPTILAVNSYGVTGNYFTINVPYSGSVYLIAADSKCSGGAASSIYVYPGNVTVKPLCTSPANLVLSNPTCHGFTASWNGDACLSNSASGYNVYLRVAGTINYNSYGASVPPAPIGPNKLINWLTSGRNYQVFVRSVYSCNGFVTYGPSSLTQTIATLSSGCRDEEDVQSVEVKPAVQQYSADNQEVFSLYPNPNNGEFVVDLSRYATEEDAVRIEVINMIGQTVVTHLTTISGGHMSEFINLPTGITGGTYIVRLTAGKNVYTTKVNISR